MSFKKYHQDQMDLLPRSVHDYLPEGHLAKVVNAVVERMDLGRILQRYSERGCSAYDPRMMVKILFYGYAVGERSSRKMASRLESDLAYMYLAGHQRPDFRTLNRFRKDHLDLLRELFGTIVRLCLEMGMIHIGTIALDGSKFKANASEEKTKWKEEVEKEIQKIVEEAAQVDQQEDQEYGEQSPYEGLPEIQDAQALRERLEEAQRRMEQGGSRQINLTDMEATTMYHQNHYPQMSYNGQVAVEAERGLIVAATVSTSPADQSAVIELVEQVEEHLEERPQRVLADSGFCTYENLQYLEQKGIEGYIPDPKKVSVERGSSKHPEFSKCQFHYEKTKDHYVCPEGKPLIPWGWQKDAKGARLKIYRGTQCGECSRKTQCTSSVARRIMRHPQEEVAERMRERLESSEGRRIYAQRQTLVEPLFGHWKQNLHYRDLLLRGKAKVTGEFFLMCIGYNLKKIANVLMNRHPLPRYSLQSA
jgi:transposase